MKKIIATITLALAAANANALVNPNKVHVLANGARVTTVQAEQIYDQAQTLAGEPCELAVHLIERLMNQAQGNNDIFEAYKEIGSKCIATPNGNYNG